jgi:hypothetical protein
VDSEGNDKTVLRGPAEAGIDEHAGSEISPATVCFGSPLDGDVTQLRGVQLIGLHEHLCAAHSACFRRHFSAGDPRESIRPFENPGS